MKTRHFLYSVVIGLATIFHAGLATAQIYWQNNQFVVDNIRPAWQGAVANLNVGNGQSRDHIIAFEVIQNDLAVKLNNIRANNMQQAGINNLAAMTDALFIGAPQLEIQAMQQTRQNLLQTMHNNQNNNYQASAQALLGLLNSSSGNVRVGNAGINAAIGYSVDAEFQGGLFQYNGQVNAANGQQAFNGYVLHLTQHSNAIVYRYQAASGLALTFVINGLNGAQNQAAPNGVQLSSTILPQLNHNQLQHVPYPVLVMDPGNNNLPFLFH